MEVSDARNLKALAEGNHKLKKLLAESMLDVATLCEALGKKLLTPSSRRIVVLHRSQIPSANKLRMSATKDGEEGKGQGRIERIWSPSPVTGDGGTRI